MKNPVLPRIIADHLGSIRVTLDQNGNVDSWTDYYPFGKEARGSSTPNRPKEQFTSKERDAEIGLDYFGARYYNADIARWLSADPLSSKYPNFSPYLYAANNPILFFDYDGRDYGVSINHETKEIVISATYYVQKGDQTSLSSARDATLLWNSESGNFSYNVGDASYNVRFDLSVAEVDNPVSEFQNDRANFVDAANKITPDESSNVYQVNADNDKVFSKGTKGDKNGVTIGMYDVHVKQSRSATETGAHEVGHTLGLEHYMTGIMTSESSNKLREPKVIRDNVSKIIKNALQGKAGTHLKQSGKSPSGMGSGKASERKEEDEK